MSDEYLLSLRRVSAEYRDFELPPPDTKRWVTRRKAIVVNAVRAGEISLEEVCRRYELSAEEFLAWQRAIDISMGDIRGPNRCKNYSTATSG